ncbi:MAG TPA: hypothetical protein GXZ91_06495 [Christensenellaceae bacterium]|nr:hypothetical protein [Christensenellaceae bacterium]
MENTSELIDENLGLQNTESDTDLDTFSLDEREANLNKKEMELKEKLSEIKRKEELLHIIEMEQKARDMVSKRGLPMEAVQLIDMQSEETIKESIDILQKLLSKIKMEQTAPAVGDFKPAEPLTYSQRAELYLTNR